MSLQDFRGLLYGKYNSGLLGFWMPGGETRLFAVLRQTGFGKRLLLVRSLFPKPVGYTRGVVETGGCLFACCNPPSPADWFPSRSAGSLVRFDLVWLAGSERGGQDRFSASCPPFFSSQCSIRKSRDVLSIPIVEEKKKGRERGYYIY